MKTILKKKHKENCRACGLTLNGEWNTPWAYIKGFENADSIGRIRDDKYRGWRRWAIIGCNDTGCPAEVWVLESDILEEIEHYISQMKITY